MQPDCDLLPNKRTFVSQSIHLLFITFSKELASEQDNGKTSHI